MLPNFLIVGAMKAGTTTLRDYLNVVDGVWIYPGELRFFSVDRRYARGLEWYERHFEAAKGAAVIGEKSPAYAYQPAVPARIQKHLPDVKLVWIFRDPVARAYSHYWHAATRGKERLSFRSAIEREDERIHRNFLRGYTRRSRYIEQVERYLQYFAKEQMLFLLFEELVKSPTTVMNRLLTFIGSQSTFDPAQLPSASNVTHAPRSVGVEWLGRTVFGRGDIYRLIRRFNVRPEPGYPKIPRELRDRLQQSFAIDNARLADVTGLDLSVWQR